ncbi:hypothetical protein SFC07_01825 [Corynebacterium callunae]|uniref:hypothetical protein n=1 Tax=Corynebacterium callunae TaxID=1721 RepID=UPI003981C759
MTTSGVSVNTSPYEGYAAADVAAQPAPQKPRMKINKSVGAYAGALALSFILFAIGGVIWGLLRPTYTAFVEDVETASVAVAENVEFTGYAWFTLATGAIAAAIALFIFLRSPRTRGLLMMAWLGVLAAAGAVVFLVFGSYASTLLHGVPADYADAIGQSFQVAPTLQPGVALAAAPFLSVCMYWCATFVTPEDEVEPAATPEEAASAEAAQV